MQENKQVKRIWETKITGKMEKRRSKENWDKNVQQILEKKTNNRATKERRY